MSVRVPQRKELEVLINDEWRPIKSQSGLLDRPQGHRANVVKFDPIDVVLAMLVLLPNQRNHARSERVRRAGKSCVNLDSVATAGE